MKNEGGFTIVEVLVAIMILSVGLVALASTAATVTRMIVMGQIYTEASTLASERFEILRAQDCDDLIDGSEIDGAYTVAWTVAAVQGNRGREIEVTVTSTAPGGSRTDNFVTTRFCES